MNKLYYALEFDIPHRRGLGSKLQRTAGFIRKLTNPENALAIFNPLNEQQRVPFRLLEKFKYPNLAETSINLGQQIDGYRTRPCTAKLA